MRLNFIETCVPNIRRISNEIRKAGVRKTMAKHHTRECHEWKLCTVSHDTNQLTHIHNVNSLTRIESIRMRCIDIRHTEMKDWFLDAEHMHHQINDHCASVPCFQFSTNLTCIEPASFVIRYTHTHNKRRFVYALRDESIIIAS